MKSFAEKINEASPAAGGFAISPDIQAVDVNQDGGIYNLDNPAVLARINGVIGKYVEEQFIDPFQVVRAVREHLSHIGVGFMTPSFGDVNLDEDSSTVTVPLFRWGGRYGRLKDDDAEIFEDDGIVHRGQPLSITFDFLKLENNKFSVAVKIITT